MKNKSHQIAWLHITERIEITVQVTEKHGLEVFEVWYNDTMSSTHMSCQHAITAANRLAGKLGGAL
jgi:hypothetical protein